MPRSPKNTVIAMAALVVVCFVEFSFGSVGEDDGAGEGDTGCSIYLEGEAPREDFFSRNQGLVNREDFERRLGLLIRNGSPKLWKISDEAVVVNSGEQPLKLEFAPIGTASRPNKFWRTSKEFNSENMGRKLPLEGLKVALDPGHIGGEWAAKEGRLFFGKCGTRIAEGDMTLATSILIGRALRDLGATVFWTRKNSIPLALGDLPKLRERASKHGGRGSQLDRETTKLLLREAEIEARAKLINDKIQPDVTVCLHFNAEDWGSSENRIFSQKNHFHTLIGGAYLTGELGGSSQQMNLFRKAAEGAIDEELPLAVAVSAHVAELTGLPPFDYGRSPVAKATESPYVWKRNLMATRLFQCPVVYLEPFVMNNADFIASVREASGSWARASSRGNVFEQYAKGVVRGILQHYSLGYRGNIDTGRGRLASNRERPSVIADAGQGWLPPDHRDGAVTRSGSQSGWIREPFATPSGGSNENALDVRQERGSTVVEMP